MSIKRAVIDHGVEPMIYEWIGTMLNSRIVISSGFPLQEAVLREGFHPLFCGALWWMDF
jgi:hypothetical protein